MEHNETPKRKAASKTAKKKVATGLPESLHHKDVEEVAEKMHEAAETPPEGPLEG